MQSRKYQSIRNIILVAAIFVTFVAQSVRAQTRTTALDVPELRSPWVQNPPKTWMDTETGRRVTRLTDEPMSQTIYFDKNAFTPDGRDMVYVAKDGLHLLNLATMKTRLVVTGSVTNVIMGTKSRRVFFTNLSEGKICAPGEDCIVDLDSGHLTQLHDLLPIGGVLQSINADESLMTGTVLEDYTKPDLVQYKRQALNEAGKLGQQHSQDSDAAHDIQLRLARDPNNPGLIKSYTEAQAKADASSKAATQALRQVRDVANRLRFDAHEPMDLFVLDLKTRRSRIIHKGTDWLIHVKFSPTDPNLILYSHEGPALEVDRVWTIRADGTDNRLMQQKSGPKMIDTHEFWGPDGKTVWFDQQESKGERFAVVGINADTGAQTTYTLTKQEASIHYNISANGKLFCGDGNLPVHGELGVNGHRTLDRAWIELLRPNRDGTFHSTRLAHLPKNDYHNAEPNVRFSPDGKLVIFTSNMFGPTYLFAVEVDKAPTTVANAKVQ